MGSPPAIKFDLEGLEKVKYKVSHIPYPYVILQTEVKFTKISVCTKH